MRIFIALLLPQFVKDKVYSYIENLESRFTGNYTSYNNLHLTLYYIGEIDQLQLDQVFEEIKRINYQTFDYETENLGSFKNSNKQRLVHVKVKQNHNLSVLHLKVVNALKLAGIIIESTDFSPHITLGRKVNITIEELKQMKSEELSIKASRISIMESKRVDNILVYEEVYYHLLSEKKH